MRVRSLLMAAAGLVSVVVAGPVRASSPPGSGAAAGVVGEAVALAAGVVWRAGAGGAYASVAARQPVAVGDGVRTDATGFAEVAYADGSLTRLDVETEFEVVALTDEAGSPVTRTALGVGRVWNRVQAVGAASGGFEVVTSQATASVRGTAFLVSCLTVDSCDFSVMEGVIDVVLADGSVVTVTGPATLNVTGGVASGPVPLGWDGLFGDLWLVANTDLDVEAGYADRATVYSAYGPAYASMVGTFAGEMTWSVACSPNSCEEMNIGAPPDGPVTVEVANNCTADGCSVAVGSRTLAFDGAAWAAAESTTDSQPWCINGSTGQESGVTVMASSRRLTPTAAAVVDGAYLITEMAYEAMDSISYEQGAADCPTDVTTNTGTATLTRTPN
jgi:hypothetical protein